MAQNVRIKSSRNGINLILADGVPFAEICEEAKERFAESAKFFAGAEVVLSVQGRRLSAEELTELVDTVAAAADLTIRFVADGDELWDATIENEVHRFFERQNSALDGFSWGDVREYTTEEDVVEGIVHPLFEHPEVVEFKDLLNEESGVTTILQKDGFYQGSLFFGQALESRSGIVIYGDVNPGAHVVSYGNVLVFGALKGSVTAGAAGDRSATVAALELDPEALSIAGLRYTAPEEPKEKKKGLFGRKEKPAARPQIARIADGSVIIEAAGEEDFLEKNIR